MVLELKPVGRGNWATLVATITGKRAQPLLVTPGDKIVLGGITYRICKVLP